MRTRFSIGAFAVAAAALLAGPQIGAQTPATPQPRKLDLHFKDGNVTLEAQSVTVREVMTEWSKKCDCRIEGLDKITDAPVGSVSYENQPEATVLKSLLNANVSSGYFLLARNPGETGASQYATVGIAPVSHASATTYAPTNSPGIASLVTTPDDEIPPVRPINIPAVDAAQQQAAPKPPASPSLPPGILPSSGVGRAGGPAAPTVPPGTGRGGGQ